MSANWGLIVAGVGAAVLGATLLHFRHEDAKIRKAVFTNLDHALEGGQFEPELSGYLHGMSAIQIADDMMLHCDDVSMYSVELIFPYVEEWLEKRQP
jgi:hypothetical protein